MIPNDLEKSEVNAVYY